MQPDLQSNDYYKVLGVPRDASKAYTTLNDPVKRREYDDYGKDDLRSSGGLSSEEAEALYRNVFTGSGASYGRASGGSSMPFTFVQSTETNRGYEHSFGGMHIDIDSIFQNLYSGGHPRKDAYSVASHVIPAGAAVIIRGLHSSTSHNGSTGRVKGFDAARGRYQVAVEHGNSDVLLLKPGNLTQQCSIEVTNLESKPELNGKVGDIFNYDAENERYMVLLHHPPTAIALQRKNSILAEGTRVVLDGLSKESYNGQMAQIACIDRSTARYTVRCQDGSQIKVTFDKVIC
jgi:hypothetical protein